MTFNLLSTPWIEVRRASGACGVVRSCDVTGHFQDDPIVALNFPRPDWNAALTEFLIGLCYLILAPDDEEEWAELFIAPPPPDALQAKLAPFVSAFDFDGDGPCAYQDFDPLVKLESKALSSLLIDAPGENALRNNSDLFIKRDGVKSLNLAYAAAALITLQTYAPSGGAGHRTSMRGGGPLTTLLSPRRSGSTASTLWDRIWVNVPNKDDDAPKPKSESIFPWLTPTRTSVNNEMVIGADSRSALAFFACPRRIRLEFAANVICDLSGHIGEGVTGFRTQNYGANYLYWRHPLSPYRADKKSGDLPIHPNSGSSDYGDWRAWWGFDGQSAKPITLWKARRQQISSLIDPSDGIEAFGFDMDNMKARQWLNASFPWIPIHEASASALKEGIEQAIQAADCSAKALGRNAKIAIYGQRQGIDGPYRLPENLSMDAFKEPSERLWRDSEADFKTHLQSLQDRLKDGSAQTSDLNEQWLQTLKHHAMRIFDESVDIDGLTNADPRRLLWARDRLGFEFANDPKAGVRKALGLAVTSKTKKDAT